MAWSPDRATPPTAGPGSGPVSGPDQAADRSSPLHSRPQVRHELAFLAMDEDVTEGAGQVGEIPVFCPLPANSTSTLLLLWTVAVGPWAVR